MVRTVENPTDGELRRLQESLGPNERIVDTESACTTYCREDCDTVCPYEICHYSATCTDTQYCCRDTTTAA